MSTIERPVRVLLVGRHFWPHGSIDSAGHLMELATGLCSAGLHVSVLTPKYASAWPDRITFRELSVYRPARVFRTGWTARGDRSVTRYLQYLSAWIESNSVSCDLIYCDSAREETIACVEAARNLSVPAVVRIAGGGREGDLSFFDGGRIGKRCRTAAINADAVVIGGAAVERRWIVEGGDRGRVRRIPIGIGPTLDQGLSSRSRLRRSMSKINGDLFVPDNAAVVLSVERLNRGSGVMTLVNSAYSLSEQIEGLHFWLIGDGPLRETIYSQLKADGLRQSMAMPGSFGIIDDALAAADLLVHVGEQGFDYQIPTAIAAGLPLIVANTATAREFFSVSEREVQQCIQEKRHEQPDSPDSALGKPGSLVWWFDPNRRKTLRFAIQSVVDNLESARARAIELRRLMQRSRPRSESIDAHVSLFRELVDQSQSAQSRSSAGQPLSMKKAQ